MASAPLSGYRSRPSPRRRATALLLAVGLVVLVILALIQLGVFALPPPHDAPPLNTFNVTEQARGGSRPIATARPRVEQHHTATPPPKAVTPPPPPVVVTPSPAVPYLSMSRDQFAASDISRYHSERADKGSDDADAHNSVAVAGPGDGPHGEQLYNAEWYRKPSDAELSTYLPHGGAVAGASAMIACKTVEHYHVEDCEELGESPPGSGLSRALRQAAWQFLVRPPRIGGKPQIGAWVRIRFTFTADGKDNGSGNGD